ncbi:barstar family protein [Rhodococcus sp. HM1]|uniref:barstar family protein n=1 Tax=Rhodococcus sp. HM1 TaxID=2937759 RepID=UPI00200A3626|nr:barstar family protein [Rhodococcus sp. HM1]MCK8673946.1 barstar family protein [Rhodococcus sp. HM1]
MVRKAVFDPTDKDAFIEQRQRFDWTLLQNGTVFRYETAFHLDSACDRLAALGYLVHRIDGHDWTSTDDMYDAFARAMSYDPDYGRGPDAFVDTLRDVAAFTFGSDPSSTGTVLAVAGFDTVVHLDRYIAHVTLDGFACQARLAGLFGHPMLCLVQSTCPDLGPVGGVEVYRESVWEDPPPDSWPIHAGEIVEFRIETLGRDAAAFIEVIESVLFELLGDRVRWQVLAPTPLDGADTTGREADGRLECCDVVVSFGVRGEGDIGGVEDALYAALRTAGIRAGAMWDTGYSFGAERERIFAKYSALGQS